MTISMSASGNFIASDCVIPLNDPDLEQGEKFDLERRALKIEAQEVNLVHPCVASNIGNHVIMIQSVIHPDKIACLRLNKLASNLSKQAEFVCFTQYHSLEDIGFIDKRRGSAVTDVPFSEKGERVAFITRTKGACQTNGKKLPCKRGDLILNVLQIDSYGSNMKYKLSTTTFEACIDEGISDDYVQNSITAQLTSKRGLDVTFIMQYRDRIIFDCVTSTV